MRNRTLNLVLAATFLMALLLGACQNSAAQSPELDATRQAAVEQTLTAAPTSTPLPSATATITPTATATPEPVNYGPTGFPANVNPLTGLEVSDPAILDRRPVMIKVANFPAYGRPHAGLSSADIVFDYYTGEGANRFIALFYGTDATKVGPVRSGRMVDRWLVRMYQGILGMEYAYESVFNAIVANLGNRVIYSDHCPALCSDGPVTEVSRFANTSEFSALYAAKQSATNDKPNLDGIAFSSIAPTGGVEASQFTMHYGKNNNALWKFDPASGKYLRWIDEVSATGEATMIPLVDRNTNAQLQFSNIIVVFAELDTLNNADTLHDYDIMGRNGRAFLFRDGQMYDIFWKSGGDMPLQFLDAAKNPVALQPGNTWIHLTGVNSRIVEDPAGVWEVRLGKP